MSSHDKSRFNILVAAPSAPAGNPGVPGIAIHVRYSWTRLTSAEQGGMPAGTPVSASFKGAEFWDETALPLIGKRAGAVAMKYPVEEMRAFISELKSHWGDIHVQDNSGLLPDLHNGMFC